MTKLPRKARRRSVADADRWAGQTYHLLQSLSAEARELRTAEGVDAKELDVLLIMLKDARSALLSLTPRWAAGAAR
jgi:hypothetical protein